MSADCGLRGLDLLDAVIARAGDDPASLDMDSWRCCVAARACEMAGAEWVSTDSSECELRTPDGRVSQPAAYGREVLGLDSRTAVRLFVCAAGLDDVRRVRDQIAAKAGEPS